MKMFFILILTFMTGLLLAAIFVEWQQSRIAAERAQQQLELHALRGTYEDDKPEDAEAAWERAVERIRSR